MIVSQLVIWHNYHVLSIRIQNENFTEQRAQ